MTTFDVSSSNYSPSSSVTQKRKRDETYTVYKQALEDIDDKIISKQDEQDILIRLKKSTKQYLQNVCEHKNFVKDRSSYDEYTSWKCTDCGSWSIGNPRFGK